MFVRPLRDRASRGAQSCVTWPTDLGGSHASPGLRRRLRKWWNSSAVSTQHGRDGIRDVYPNRMNARASLDKCAKIHLQVGKGVSYGVERCGTYSREVWIGYK